MSRWIVVAAITCFSPLAGQIFRPPLPPPPSAQATPGPAAPPRIERADPPPPGIVLVRGIHQQREGEKYRLRQNAELETVEYLLQADEIDYDEETGLAEARGAVRFVNFQSGERLWADRADYNLSDKSGTFYKVRGSIVGKIDPRPGILSTSNPFLFRGQWAEQAGNKYTLHKGAITNCEGINPWWTLNAPVIDIIPNERALAYKSMLRLRHVPLLYAPVFYKDLSTHPRRSGFLTPNFGNSNRRGLMFGLGYFWAINRSYDVTYRPQYFTQRGFAHTLDFRGKPTQSSDFNAYFYSVNDKGLLQNDGSRLKQGGYIVAIQGKAQLGAGFYARGNFNYLSNFEFRQAFTESFNEAVFSEVNSAINVSRDWSTFHLNAVMTRLENFQSAMPGDTILLRKLPQVEFDSRDRELNRRVLPVWVSWGSSVGLLRRNQPLFQTRQFVERFDVEPRIMTALRWKDFHLVPAFSIRDTHYGASFRTKAEMVSGQQVTGDNLNRFSREFSADLLMPSLVRIFNAPRWMGSKMKHSIEPRASFRAVTGVDHFQRTIRFDEMDLLSNTSEADVAIVNRLWTKTPAGQVWDFLSWEVRQRRFFDPQFGGALIAGQRNVFLSSASLTAFAFIDQPRNYSPVVSTMRLTPRPGFGVEWRSDYDPLRAKMTNSSLTADARLSSYFFSVGHSKVSCVPLGSTDIYRPDMCSSQSATKMLAPASNQFRGMIGLGQENRRGWNAGFLAIYDYATASMQYANTQITYNTDCCSFSGQFRRFNFGTRNENQYRVALVIANIGSFGTLRRQERLF